MDIYLRKRRWKLILFTIAIVIVATSLYYTNILVNEIRKDERKNVAIWADAIHHKADLVNVTNKLFEQIKDEERRRVITLAEAQRRIITATSSEDLNFFLGIISNNTTIPVIQTDDNGIIVSSRNIRQGKDSLIGLEGKKLDGKLLKDFSKYAPIIVNYYKEKKIFLYYRDSNIFTELKKVIDELIDSFFSEVVLNSASVPVIVTDSTGKKWTSYGNIPKKKMEDPRFVEKTLNSMASENPPIVVNLANTGIHLIYFEDSFLLKQLQYYPYVQLAVIALFLFIAYLLFSYARKSEQNQVWVGMAKETAHQLGTPLSSMVAWIELLKLKGLDNETVIEIEKDVQRLETITDRFSKIGSAAKLEKLNIVQVVHQAVGYISTRTSQKVKFEVSPPPLKVIEVPLNLHLFEWVIENLCKNAVDAMEGSGLINVEISEDVDHIHIDISDTGKGIPKSRFKTIFHPGFTSKSRGWGLGLTLSKRIIENYHTGKIFVKSSTLGKGTTFRIILKK
ncbi:MAG: HAMP domain-containing sensor histidine kinase [Bacteroidetes bacterium]|nr:HAMP domain-containing sensor histidine kinase [Bacteroidota bacterium]